MKLEFPNRRSDNGLSVSVCFDGPIPDLRDAGNLLPVLSLLAEVAQMLTAKFSCGPQRQPAKSSESCPMEATKINRGSRGRRSRQPV